MKLKILSVAFMLSCSVFLLSVLTGWKNKRPAINTKIIRESAVKSMNLLQKSAYVFTNNAKFKCASCHHNTLTAMATELAKLKGIPVVDSLEKSNVATMEYTIKNVLNPNLVNDFLPVNFVAPYILVGLYAEKYPANSYTDLGIDYLMSQARADGSFLTESGRIPLESGDIHLAAMAIRAIQVYASPAKKNQVDGLVANTRKWLEQQTTSGQQELAFQLLGMQWCGSSHDQKMKVFKKLVSMQNDDGGWSQLPTLKSDAYATGQVLYAMYESGMAKPEDEVYQSGLKYLLKTQDDKGAWEVATRSFPIQPFVDSQFPPYNRDQFISAAATNWSVMALMNALPDKKE